MFWELQDPATGRRVLLNFESLAAIIELPQENGSAAQAGAVSVSGAAFNLPFTFEAAREMIQEIADADEDEDEGKE